MTSYSEEFDSYIVVSFMNATLILSIGETVEEVTESGFLGTTPTLACSQLGEDALIQVGVVLLMMNTYCRPSLTHVMIGLSETS